MPWNPGLNGSTIVSALVQNAGTLYAVGNFTGIGGTTRNRIAAIDAGTGAASAWNPDADGTVSKVAPSGADVLVGGSFATIGGAPRNGLARIDVNGVADDWDPSPAIDALTAILSSGSDILVGGASRETRWVVVLKARP